MTYPLIFPRNAKSATNLFMASVSNACFVHAQFISGVTMPPVVASSQSIPRRKTQRRIGWLLLDSRAFCQARGANWTVSVLAIITCIWWVSSSFSALIKDSEVDSGELVYSDSLLRV